MRDGTRQIGSRAPASSSADGLLEWLAVEGQFTERRPPGEERPPADAEPASSERITLIEFMWSGLTGTQLVILVSRQWLQ